MAFVDPDELPAEADRGVFSREPTFGETVADTFKGAAAGLPTGGVNSVAGLGLKAPMGMYALARHLWNPEWQPSPEMKAAARTIDARQQQANAFLTGGYRPKTAFGDTAMSATQAVVPMMALSPEAGMADYAAAMLGGGAGNVAGRMAADSNGRSNDLVQAVVSAAPSLGLGGIRTLAARGVNKVLEAGESAASQMQPEEINTMLDREAEAEAHGVPSMSWQNAPVQSTIRRLGMATAKLPKANETQALLRAQQGGVEGEHLSANDLWNARNVEGSSMNPEANEALEYALRTLDPLRGSHINANEITGSGTEEVGHIALGMEALGPVLPHGVKAMLGGMEFARLGAVKRLLSGPAQAAADDLAASRTWEEYTTKLYTNPMLPAYRSFFQGAYGVPAANNVGVEVPHGDNEQSGLTTGVP